MFENGLLVLAKSSACAPADTFGSARICLNRRICARANNEHMRNTESSRYEPGLVVLRCNMITEQPVIQKKSDRVGHLMIVMRRRRRMKETGVKCNDGDSAARDVDHTTEKRERRNQERERERDRHKGSALVFFHAHLLPSARLTLMTARTFLPNIVVSHLSSFPSPFRRVSFSLGTKQNMSTLSSQASFTNI